MKNFRVLKGDFTKHRFIGSDRNPFMTGTRAWSQVDFSQQLAGWMPDQLQRDNWRAEQFFEGTQGVIVWGAATEETDEDEYDFNENMAGGVGEFDEFGEFRSWGIT